MSAILSKALDEIKRTIPKEVLKVVFTDQLHSWRKAPVSLDEKILNDVIRPRVLEDANLVGGTEAIISLDGLEGIYIDNFTVMYEIPMRLTNNRRIMSIKSIGYLPYAVSFSSFGAGVGVVGPSGISDLTGAGQRVGDSASNIPPVSEANVDLIGLNTIVIRNFRRITAAYHLRCMVSNEERLNNINPRSYHAFSKLCQLAVRSHIYNEMYIKMDKAFLQAGQDLGAFKSWVDDKCSDAEEQYQTHLHEVWTRVAFANDANAYLRFIKVQVNPGI